MEQIRLISNDMIENDSFNQYGTSIINYSNFIAENGKQSFIESSQYLIDKRK